MGRVTRDGQILDHEVRAPIEAPDDPPNLIAVVVLGTANLFNAEDAGKLRSK
jgi:hypothetical protein